MDLPLHQPVHADPELTVRLATAEDVRDLAPRLRIADKAEICASTGERPVVALARGFADSTPCYTAEFRGRPAAMFGAVPMFIEDSPARFGAVWLLGSDDIPLFRRRFLRHSRAWLSRVEAGFDVVGNVVDARNISHIRWLRWLGFRFVRTVPKFGHLGLPFHEFVKTV